MPGKHVHFVDVPSTPSSTFSLSTVSSSPGPSTPPTMFFSPPSAKSNHPSLYTPAIHLHPVLARTVGNGNGTPLSWDISGPPEHAIPNLPYAPRRVTDSLICEPATNPPLPSLAIICDYLPWTISITPTPNALWSQPYITVGDVLHVLHRTLRLPVTDPEMNVLEPAQQDRVRDAYVRRYRRVADQREREAEKAKSIKRVDFLRDHRAFLGLSLVPAGLPAKGFAPGTVWMLHVA